MPGSASGEQIAGRVAEVVRYPVKSMAGESIEAVELTRNGVAGDRLFAFETDAAPPGMLRVSGRERRELLRFSARHAAGDVLVHTPEGQELSVTDPRLLTVLPDFAGARLTRSQIPQTDCRPVSLISLQTIERLSDELHVALDRRRFRANFYLDMPEPFGEDRLVGQVVQLGGTARLRILERDPRCRFITLDPETTEPLPELMTLLHRHYQSRAGVYASVEQTGCVRAGDELRVVKRDAGAVIL